ncbi:MULTISPECIES: DUF4301 family protein [unclassified Carboxylicivirga]|uniref:DUF4301 family protein n=1 Tax=Carboxylicivirga TaxID=1628153 RepID=UPI003D33A27C
MLSEKDYLQIHKEGITPERISKQLEHFEAGFPYARLVKAATINDGIIRTNKYDETTLIEKYNRALNQGLDVIKFVPASGAATRMFKSLFEFLQADDGRQQELLNQEPYQTFLRDIRKFAFGNALTQGTQVNTGNESVSVEAATTLIEGLLLPKGLNYGQLPKGLLLFHHSENSAFTPLEEHLKETAAYASDGSKGKVHFTVSPEHEALFKTRLEERRNALEKVHNCKFEVSFSYQKPSTNTLAVKPDNTPFRQSDGNLLFRPAGHGALIENLNDLAEEMVFIKNIDNVVPQHLLSDTIHYKQVLAGLLLSKKEQVFAILEGIDSQAPDAIDKGVDFLCSELQITDDKMASMDHNQKAAFIKEHLNRPIRVCGMVKNEGEPGGGPFWVKQSDGTISLQIVESAQIHPKDGQQQEIVKSSTHFNPVDLVCYTKDYQGQKFDLTNFVDPETGFISEKTQNGKALKALELPGLWNGAMAHWLSFFVEVPISTFNPVKTVMDLLRPQHQPA